MSGDIYLNKEMQGFLRLAKKHGARINPAHTMMSRGIATVQGTITEICPEVDFYSEIKDYAIRLRLSEITKKKDRDIERLKRYLMFKKIKEVPENLANTIEEYSKGLAPIKMEMGIAERSEPFVKDIVRMLVDGFVIVALLVSSSIKTSGVRDPAAGTDRLPAGRTQGRHKHHKTVMEEQTEQAEAMIDERYKKDRPSEYSYAG